MSNQAGTSSAELSRLELATCIDCLEAALAADLRTGPLQGATDEETDANADAAVSACEKLKARFASLSGSEEAASIEGAQQV